MRVGRRASSKPSWPGAWFVVALEPGDPFVGSPEHLWRDVLRRQRGRLALFSNYPEDATAN